jgi:hypothetical protein
MTTVAIRQPLGLPAGSVRALLTFIVLGLIWALMLLQKEIPLYLFYLMFLIVGGFFAAHGHSIAGPASDSRNPLYLPRGTLRTLIILGFAAVLGWRYYLNPDWHALLEIKQAALEQPYLPLVLLGAFFFGVFVARIVSLLSGSQGTAPWWQDIQSWLALLGALGLAGEVLIQFVINPSLPEGQQIQYPPWQAILGAIVAFYFGARS